MNFNYSSYSICETACKLFLSKGYEKVTMSDIAIACDLPEAELYTHFGNRHDIILFLYQRLNQEWKWEIESIEDSTLANRFEKAMMKKIDLIEPYINLLSDMMGLLLNSQKLGVHSARTSHIRAIGLQCMDLMLQEASDHKKLTKRIEHLPSLLFMMHWSVLFLFVQSKDRSKAMATLKLLTGALKKANQLAALLPLMPLMNEAGHWAETMLGKENQGVDKLDREILNILFNHRKLNESDETCVNQRCEVCVRLHAEKIHYFTQQNKAIHFILPAFPAKSPNLQKVLGSLPDLGEEIALNTLEDLCREINSIYPPGAHVTICSDGRIFSELVGVSDEQISQYVAGIKELITHLNLHSIDIVNLEDLLQGHSFQELRNQVLTKYAESLDELHLKLKSSDEFKTLFNGIHRFISEDRKVLQPEKSMSLIKTESKEIALKVIQHSNAWTRFLSNVFPDAFRLSIHPYHAHSEKTGIRLTKATDNWLTPWHGVIVLKENEYILMKKQEAELLGATLMMRNEQPSYYTLMHQS